MDTPPTQENKPGKKIEMCVGAGGGGGGMVVLARLEDLT